MVVAASESDFLVKIAGIPDYWSTRTGGDAPREVNQAFNGGDEFPTPVIGKRKPNPMTVSRPFDPGRDQALIKELRRRTNVRFTVSQYPTDPDGKVVGEPTVWTDCLLTNIVEPETNAGSGSAAMVQLTVMPGRVI